MDHASKGEAALSSGDFASAISHFTSAIATSPQAVSYYIKRSTAHTRISPPNYQAALSDAEIAVFLANKRAKRELIAQSQLRRAIALFGIEKYSESKQCIQWVRKLDEKEKSLAIWEAKIENKLKGRSEDVPNSKTTVPEIPEVQLPKSGQSMPAEKSKSDNSTNGVDSSTSPSVNKPKPEGVQTPASKIRHEWYQSSDTVSVTLFAKGVPKDRTIVDIKSSSLDISFPLPTGSDFDFSLDPLFSQIDPDKSSYKVMSTKVEFSLKKSTPGQKWHSLEGVSVAEDKATDADSREGTDAVRRAVLAEKPAQAGPAYPTSSKSGPKNWDKVASDLTKKKKTKAEEETAKDDAEEAEDDVALADDDDEGDPVNGFFKKLYKDSDPDTRRAMMKSYQESNGTALSTNWSEVGKAPVETTPPDGMEAKKW